MSKSNFDRLFALLATAAVVIGVISGFWLLGSPNKQRQLRADQQRLEDILGIAQRFHQLWTLKARRSQLTYQLHCHQMTASKTLSQVRPMSINA